MVKNAMGGNKAKKFGRKHISGGAGGGGGGGGCRMAKEDDEIYAVVNKIFGGTADVKCIDGKKRIMVIRNKFKGRGKRDNILNIGTWVLVGRRSFEAARDDGKEKCDLLEVYGANDVSRLKQMDSDMPWHVISTSVNSDRDGAGAGDDGDIAFVDQRTMAYEAAMENAWTDLSNGRAAAGSDSDSASDSDSEIDIDTI